MTFARHFWVVIKFVVTTLWVLPRRYKFWGTLAGIWAYNWDNYSSRWPYTWQFVHRHVTIFVLTVLQIAIPVLYLSCRLVFGLLYPAYASYKAVKTKNVKEYVKWMMYWIVFAIFCAVETFTDVFLSWLPFYYEIKIIFVFWLLSPVTKGASFLYRKFVHPQLNKREKEIDEAISQARTKGYSTLMTLGHKGLTYATNVVVTTAIKGQTTLVEHVKKSYSTNDLRIRNDGDKDEPDSNIAYIVDESDEEFDLTGEKSTKQTREADNRLMADNKELSSREKKDRSEKSSRRPLIRSKSDATDIKVRRSRNSGRASVSELTPLDEVDQEGSMVQDSEEVIETNETFYIPASTHRKYSRVTSKEAKADPYATLPRTRSRQRPRLNQY